MNLIIKTLVFKTPYHSGWRHTERLLSNTTLIRSLTLIASQLNLTEFINKVRNGKLRSSALLPAILDKEGVLRPLLPLIKLPSKIKDVKASWISLKAAQELLRTFRSCKEVPIIVDLIAEKDHQTIIFECNGKLHKGLAIKGKVIIHQEELNHINGVNDLIVPYKEIRNRIDRVSGSADLFPVVGHQALTPLWFLMISEEINEVLLDRLLNILSKLGIGGLRSRGWGRFEIVKIPIHKEYKEILEKGVFYKEPNYYISLGDTSLSNIIDLRKSIIELGFIEGLSGVSNNLYILPKIALIRPGSIVYLTKRPYDINLIEEVEIPYLNYKPFIQLSTIFWG